MVFPSNLTSPQHQGRAEMENASPAPLERAFSISQHRIRSRRGLGLTHAPFSWDLARREAHREEFAELQGAVREVGRGSGRILAASRNSDGPRRRAERLAPSVWAGTPTP